ncbi:FecR domain-containing protein [Salegentibacter sp. JZCK2]|uniref:FecR family protein n=1 Tax=Salegentibacter tibetensis TaxID=2873600 RepID=UPI001CCE02B8|nr:FecR domain-containing protein [Salegentibacter tibetensis]MBZ9728776.1 FecR domain-containing protein [Salegentibacter tibetensis]
MENKKLIKKWLNGELSPVERAVFEKSPEYHDYKEIVQKAALFQKPDFNEEKNLHLLKERMKRSQSRKGRLLRLPAVLKIAAILVLLLASGFFIYFNASESVITETGQFSLVELPDNSKVRLSAESKVKYYPRRWEGKRIVHLDGEAFFEVEKGSEFKVKTDEGIVEVLGTSFNVINRAGFFEVICYEGSVKVTHSGRESVLLKNELYQVIEGQLQQGAAVVEETPGWIKNESSFRAVPFKFVLSEMERQFGLKITADNVDGEQLFSGSFSHSDLETALRSITVPLGLNYKIESGNKVELYEE